ncbi:MAG: N-acetyltransferase [Bryobacteraceae bacterium]
MQDTFTVRKAVMKDISHILRLINAYAAQGIMLSRTEVELSENIRDFSVIESEDGLVGCAALHFYSPTTGEIRSLAVSPLYQGRGAGVLLVQELENEAQFFNLHNLFAFTYIPRFFAKFGYREIERSRLPLKVWKDCLRCPKFENCDEIAVLKEIGIHYNVGIKNPAYEKCSSESHSVDLPHQLPRALPSH